MDSWFEIADLNYARSDASAVAYNGRIYIAGGINDANIEASVEVYYPEANHWQLVKPMINPRTSFGLICYNDRIWAIGGNNGTGRLNSVESFDPNKDETEWREEQPLINDRSTFRAINFNGELFVIGGYNGKYAVHVTGLYTMMPS